tara:strand:- start:2675 stop:3064 length:390 start_codon:yes stop_codon:yes gene_type:complete
MKNLLWLNDYNLNFDYKNSEKIFIFSEDYVNLISPQRLKIVYKYLCQRKVRIFKGDYCKIIEKTMIEEDFDRIIVPNCSDAKILKTANELKQRHDVKIFQSSAVMFSDVKSSSFFKFWNLIKNDIGFEH